MGTANVRDLRVRIAPNAQLAVCMGVVEDRLQKLNAGESILGWRVSRSSYDVKFVEKYDPGNPQHRNRQRVHDSTLNADFLIDCVEW